MELGSVWRVVDGEEGGDVPHWIVCPSLSFDFGTRQMHVDPW